MPGPAPSRQEEHIYVASELKRLDVQWVSMAPPYIGRFEKEIDYIGDGEYPPGAAYDVWLGAGDLWRRHQGGGFRRTLIFTRRRWSSIFIGISSRLPC